MTLTEQWKKGEIEQGYYYTEYNPKVGKPFVEIELRSYLLDLAKVRDVDTVEVLAPVPSYEEWRELIDKKYWCNARAKNLLEKNQQLKELLMEWVQFEIEENPNDFTVISERMSGLANKTKQAIGE